VTKLSSLKALSLEIGCNLSTYGSLFFNLFNSFSKSHLSSSNSSGFSGSLWRTLPDSRILGVSCTQLFKLLNSLDDILLNSSDNFIFLGPVSSSSASASNAYKPAGAIWAPCDNLANWALNKSFSLPGKWGLTVTLAFKSPVNICLIFLAICN